MRPDWLAEEERARDRAAANALFEGQGFTGVAQSPNRPDQLSQPDSSAFSTVSSSIGTSDTFLSTRQIGSGRILDIDFDMLNSGIEARNPVAKAGFNDVATGARDPSSTGPDLHIMSHAELIAERERSRVPPQPAAAAGDPLPQAPRDLGEADAWQALLQTQARRARAEQAHSGRR